jgi:hypothetical protein
MYTAYNGCLVYMADTQQKMQCNKKLKTRDYVMHKINKGSNDKMKIWIVIKIIS